ncbi:MAG: hypothetical protein ABIH88_00095 [Patescibacteria group bacterium]
MVDLKRLDTKSLILDVTTNLSRIGNFTLDKNYERTVFFAKETEEYLKELRKRNLNKCFSDWLSRTQDLVDIILNEKVYKKAKKEYIADDAFTFGVVLQNRAIYLL